LIPNLNFYDIYGYLIPGFALLILFWLPTGLTEGEWPTSDWTSALVVVASAYIVGHLVQALARNAIPRETIPGPVPSSLPPSDGEKRTTEAEAPRVRAKRKKRFPSDVLLDSDDKTLSAALKTGLRERIRTFSGIDVRTDCKATEVDDDIRRGRRDGFYFCRDALLTSKTLTYAEQMEGMYTLMNGLTIVFLLAAPYHLGWAFGRFWPGAMVTPAAVLLILGVVGSCATTGISGFKPASALQLVTGNITFGRLTLAFVFSGLLGLGYTLGSAHLRNLDQGWRLLAIFAAGLFASFICHGVHKYFTVVYASTIYRAFSLYEKPAQPPKNEWRPFQA